MSRAFKILGSPGNRALPATTVHRNVWLFIRFGSERSSLPPARPRPLPEQRFDTSAGRPPPHPPTTPPVTCSFRTVRVPSSSRTKPWSTRPFRPLTNDIVRGRGGHFPETSGTFTRFSGTTGKIDAVEGRGGRCFMNTNSERQSYKGERKTFALEKKKEFDERTATAPLADLLMGEEKRHTVLLVESTGIGF